MGRTITFLMLVTSVIGFSQTVPVRHPQMRFEATAESKDGLTAKGTVAHQGIVAADPAVLPLGSIIRITGAGAYSGTYAVTDTGSKVGGRKIDIYMPTVAEAKQFGRKMVYVSVISRGDNQKNHEEVTPPAHTVSSTGSSHEPTTGSAQK